MKILLMANHCNTGGITTYLLNLSKGLIRLGHQVFLVCKEGECAEFFKDSGVECIFMDIRVKSEVHPKLWMAIPSVVKIIKDRKVQIVHAQTRVTQVMAAAASQLTGVPYVSTCHGFFKTRISRRLFPCWGKGVIAVSNGVKDHLINDFHLREEKVALIFNGIDIGQFKLGNHDERQKKRLQWHVEGGPIIGIIARLSSVKGIDVLIDAFSAVKAQFPSLCLLIVGEGPEKKRLEGLVAEKGLKAAVRFEPIVNQTSGILPIFDLFVMPSLQEGLGLAVMEAQACGIPVVASNVGGLPDLIDDGKTGLLVPPGNSRQLAEKIVFMLSHPEEALRMATAARQHITANFSSDLMVTATYLFYEKNTCR